MIKKIGHFADIHIRKSPSRNGEYYKVFENTFKELDKERPDRIVVEGDIFNDYISLESEQLLLVKFFLKGLSERTDKVIVTRGNHDILAHNKNRVDSVQMIVELLEYDNIVYYNETGFFDDDNIVWCVWKHGEKGNNSPWDKYPDHKKDKNKVYIDLFHDPINNSMSATDFELNRTTYRNVGDFKGDYLFAGDIHKKQYLNEEKTKAYCGTLIAQDFGEGDDQFHGYLLWDIENKTVNEISIPNDYTYKNVVISEYYQFDDLDIEIDNPTKHMKIRFLWRTLIGKDSSDNIRLLESYFRKKYPESSLRFYHKKEYIQYDEVDDNGMTRNKLSEIFDPEVQKEYLDNYLDSLSVSEKQKEAILLIDEYVNKKVDMSDELLNVKWDFIKLGGVNFKSYEKIDLDFSNIKGLIQIRGKNAKGKSTILSLLSYVNYGNTPETDYRMAFGDSRYVNNRNGAKFAMGYVVIEANGEYYGIERTTKLEYNKEGELKGSPTKVNYYKLNSPDDDFDELMNLDNDDVESSIESNKLKVKEKLLGIVGTYENFIRIMLTNGDTLNNILSSDPAKFIDSVIRDSGLNIFEVKNNILSDLLKKRNEKINRVSCNIPVVEKENEDINLKVIELNNILKESNITLSNYKKDLEGVNSTIESLLSKKYAIDNKLMEDGLRDKLIAEINGFNEKNKSLDAYIVKLNEENTELPESFDYKELEALNDRVNKIKNDELTLKNTIHQINRNIDTLTNKIEISRGEIHLNKSYLKKYNEEIEELTNNGEICPTCGQKITDQEHIHGVKTRIESLNEKISEINLSDKKSTENIKTIEDEIEKERIKVSDKTKEIQDLNNNGIEMLEKVGIMTNNKISYELKLSNIAKIKDSELSIKTNNLEIRERKNTISEIEKEKDKIEHNKKIDVDIDRFKLNRNSLVGSIDNINDNIKNTERDISQLTIRKENNKNLIEKYLKQEFDDECYNIYKQSLHRKGIPTLILNKILIPTINESLNNVLSQVEFDVWIDKATLRPKFARKNVSGVIDCIGSSGMERTFSSIAIKMALNYINVKSKPMSILFDEVMGKLVDESVDEFVSFLTEIKSYANKVFIIEHNNNVYADHIIFVDMDDNGISKADFI